ncbi:uncharacterized protein LOC126838942 isoform X1 [Adelges cooleyi]|uniref:uncharacterized protein LOC126838942 isoform X1 n=1 Tax=Adelges cooleyi TaxID=133065 RepID=UPI00217F7CF5|nr:uncharacterized protein LOC126838942 isoform X1 [Adelges cooleyi]
MYDVTTVCLHEHLLCAYACAVYWYLPAAAIEYLVVSYIVCTVCVDYLFLGSPNLTPVGKCRPRAHDDVRSKYLRNRQRVLCASIDTFGRFFFFVLFSNVFAAMKKLRLFVANLFVLKIIAVAVGAAATAVANGRTWAREPTASDGPKESRSIVSPRMDFDEWTPLGRGDPLKNDPTFDYLPPALEKVHYWKPPPPPPSSLATNQRAYSAVLSTAAAPVSAIHYNNRRFFLTDYPSKAAEGTYYLHKRPAPQVVVSGGFHYSVPRTPLPMLTPPPYSRPSTSLVPAAPTTARPAAAATDIGTSLAESRHPPPAAVRAPPTLTTVPGVVRPPLPASTSAIKVLLEKEIDRTTVTTAETPVRATGATAKMSAVTDPPPSLPSWPSPHGQPAAVARPMYLIIQGHSKVKTYGLATKPDDVLDRTAGVADHDHNRLDDDPSRRKRHSQ